MIKEDKDLLLKDLCARIPYGVKLQKVYDTSEPIELYSIDIDRCTIKFYKYKGECLTICDIGDIERFGKLRFKPYLFPLSSMTKEQNESWRDCWFPDLLLSTDVNYPESEKYLAISHAKSLDWLYKNHIDIYGFIPKGLAIDATGLNIY